MRRDIQVAQPVTLGDEQPIFNPFSYDILPEGFGPLAINLSPSENGGTVKLAFPLSPFPEPIHPAHKETATSTPKVGRINIDELIRMVGEGIPQKDIAVEFGVSEPAVSQAISKIRQSAARPEILDRLTPRELKFSMEVANGSSQTQAALVAYDVTSRGSARSLGCELMKDEKIQESITAILNSEGLGKRYLIKRLRDHAASQDSQASLRAVDIGLKLHNAYPETKKNINLNLNVDVMPVDLSAYK